MGFEFKAEASVSDSERRKAEAIWGENVATELSRQLSQSHLGIEIVTVSLSAGTLFCSGEASVKHDTIALSEAISVAVPRIIRTGLNDGLRALGAKRGGAVLIEDHSLTDEEVDFSTQFGIPALLGHFFSIAATAALEDFESEGWILFVRSKKAVGIRMVNDLGIKLPSDGSTSIKLSQHLRKVIKNQVVGKNAIRKMCVDYLSELESQPTRFTRGEFRDWDWLQKWARDLIPSTLHADRELLQLFLKRRFKARFVDSNDLNELRNAIRCCVEAILQLDGPCRTFDSMTLKEIAIVCNACITPCVTLSQKQLKECRVELCMRQRKYPDRSFADLLEASLPKILVIAGLKEPRSKFAKTQMDELVNCQFCGTRLPKWEHCECEFD